MNESRREEAYLTPREERTVSFLNLVFPYTVFLQANVGRREEAHSTLGRASSYFLNIIVLYAFLQADEGRREEAHSTPGEERAGSLLSAHRGTAGAVPRISGLQVAWSLY